MSHPILPISQNSILFLRRVLTMSCAFRPTAPRRRWVVRHVSHTSLTQVSHTPHTQISHTYCVPTSPPDSSSKQINNLSDTHTYCDHKAPQADSFSPVLFASSSRLHLDDSSCAFLDESRRFPRVTGSGMGVQWARMGTSTPSQRTRPKCSVSSCRPQPFRSSAQNSIQE